MIVDWLDADHPYHGGRPGLWTNALILSVGSVVLGVCFIVDGKGVTASATFDQARGVVHALGVPTGQAMRVWGVLFILVGVIASIPLLHRSASSLMRGQAIAPLAVLGLWWAAMFATYAAGHDGYGAIGAVQWTMIALCLFADASVYFQHARAGNGHARRG